MAKLIDLNYCFTDNNGMMRIHNNEQRFEDKKANVKGENEGGTIKIQKIKYSLST